MRYAREVAARMHDIADRLAGLDPDYGVEPWGTEELSVRDSRGKLVAAINTRTWDWRVIE